MVSVRIQILFLLFVLGLSGCSSSSIETRSPQLPSEVFKNIKPWVPPVDASAYLTQRFRPRYNKRHKGIDLAGKMNQPIYASNDGVVVYRGQKFRGYGQMILLDHPEGWSTLYSHLSKFAIQNGQLVKAGQLIGYMGRSGRATGVHLHFELYKNKIPIDPLSVIPIKYRKR